MKIIITQGFKNTRTLLSSFTKFFVFQTYTPDKVYQVDQSTSNIEATPALIQASISSIAVAFQSATVAHEGYVDVSAVLGATVLSTDYIELSFSAEFVLQGASSITCSKVVGSVATAITCTPTFTSGYLSYIKIEGLCNCDSTSTYTVRIHNIRNLLESKAFIGTLTYSTKASATESIGTGTLDLSTVPKLSAGILTSTTVTRSISSQGAVSIFTLAFTTPGILLDGSTIQLGLPLNQIVKEGASFTCTDPSTGTALTCSVSPAATATYNYLTINEWK